MVKFQSTLPHGERRVRYVAAVNYESNKPHSRMGSDVSERIIRAGTFKISIHTPAWGATRDYINMADQFKIFQSTLPRGERRCNICMKVSTTLFQSTLPRGERREDTYYKDYIYLFQSTLPRGERQSLTDTLTAQGEISIHTPTRGATTG